MLEIRERYLNKWLKKRSMLLFERPNLSQKLEPFKDLP
jgi:hypothetical protein